MSRMTRNDRSTPRLSLRALRASGLSFAILTLAVVPALAGCGRLTGAQAAGSVEGRWRSKSGMILTARLLPDGTLEMVDPRGGRHPFRRMGPNRWESRISRLAHGTILHEGDQLVFRREPTEEARKPLAEKKGFILARQIRAVEDRMTRVSESEPTPTAKPPAGQGQPAAAAPATGTQPGSASGKGSETSAPKPGPGD
jgi:hypothetical protein